MLQNIPIIPDRSGRIWPVANDNILLFSARWQGANSKRLAGSLSKLGLVVIGGIDEELHEAIYQCKGMLNLCLMKASSLIDSIKKLDDDVLRAASTDSDPICDILLDYFADCFGKTGEPYNFDPEQLKSLNIFVTHNAQHVEVQWKEAYYAQELDFDPPNVSIEAAVLKCKKNWKNIFQELGIQKLTVARYAVEVLAPAFSGFTQQENKSAWKFLVDNWTGIKSGLVSEYEEEDFESLGKKLLIRCRDTKCHTCDLIHDETLVDFEDIFSGAIYLPDYEFYEHDETDFVGVLRKLGMSSRLKPIVVMSALNKIIESCESDGCVRQGNVEAIEKIFNYIFYDNPDIITEPFEYDGNDDAELSELLVEKCWLPALDCPPQDSGFPEELMPDHEHRLFKIEEVYLNKHWKSVIAAQPVLAFNVPSVSDQLEEIGLGDSLDPADVAEHIANIVSQCEGGCLPPVETQAKIIKSCLYESYASIGKHANSPNELKALDGVHCILLKDHGLFVSADRVFQHDAKKLEPWARQYNPRDDDLKKCFMLLGSKPQPKVNDLFQILNEIQEKYGNATLDESDYEVVVYALHSIAKIGDEENDVASVRDNNLTIDHRHNFGDPTEMLVNDLESYKERLEPDVRWFLSSKFDERLMETNNKFRVTRSSTLLERPDESSFVEDDSQRVIAEAKDLMQKIQSKEFICGVKQLIFHYSSEWLDGDQQLEDILSSLCIRPSDGTFSTSLYWPDTEEEIAGTQSEVFFCHSEKQLYLDWSQEYKPTSISKSLVGILEHKLGLRFGSAAADIAVCLDPKFPISRFRTYLKEAKIASHPDSVEYESGEDEEFEFDFDRADSAGQDFVDQSVEKRVNKSTSPKEGSQPVDEIVGDNGEPKSASAEEVHDIANTQEEESLQESLVAESDVSQKFKPGEERSSTSSPNTDSQKTSKVSRGHTDLTGSHKTEKDISPGSAQTYDGQQHEKPVYVEHSNRLRSAESNKAVRDRNKKTKLAAVNAALRHEAEMGRYAIDANEARKNNKGYDIESWDKEPKDKNNPPEPDRYIEVKGTKNPWKELGVGLTTAQHRCGIEKGPKFWLYVVEKTDQPEQKLYEIQDPAGQITEYRFNGSWAQLAEGTRPATGAHPELGKTAYDTTTNEIFGVITQIKPSESGRFKFACDGDESLRFWRSTYACKRM